MPDPTGPAGSQRLSPADVGKRVMLRCTTPPGSSHRWSDLVGDLLSWSDGVLRIRLRDGTTAAVAEAVLAAGKVVPPAPARRRPRPRPPEELT